MINVAFCIDDNFSPYAAVALLSLVSNTKSNVTVFVIGNLSEKVREKLASLADERTTIKFKNYNIDLSDSALSERYLGRLSGITFIRYAIAEILPALDKVIYLDADILLEGDIKSLWDAPLGGMCIGAVIDDSLMAQEYQNSLELTSGRYFNAGVIVIDLEIWRKLDTYNKLKKIHSSRSYWEYNDQDVLNIALDGNVEYLDRAMNAQTYTLANKLVGSPILVHFTGQEKPWHLSSAHPYTDKYRDVLKDVPFDNELITLFLDNEDHKMLVNLKTSLPEGGRISIWGAGARGRRLITAIENEYKEFVIEKVVDKKFSGVCMGYQVSRPEQLQVEKIDAVLVATLPDKESIKGALQPQGVRVI